MQTIRNLVASGERFIGLAKGKSSEDYLIEKGMVNVHDLGWVYSRKLQDLVNLGLVKTDGDSYFIVATKTNENGKAVFEYTPSSIMKFLTEEDGILMRTKGVTKGGFNGIFDEL